MIRSKAIEVLREMSTDLLKIGEREGTSESRKAFVDACQSITAFDEVSLCFLFVRKSFIYLRRLAMILS